MGMEPRAGRDGGGESHSGSSPRLETDNTSMNVVWKYMLYSIDFYMYTCVCIMYVLYAVCV